MTVVVGTIDGMVFVEGLEGGGGYAFERERERERERVLLLPT